MKLQNTGNTRMWICYVLGELKHALSLSKPKVLFCSPKTSGKFFKILSEHPYIRHVVLFGKYRTIPRIPKCNVSQFQNIIKGSLLTI